MQRAATTRQNAAILRDLRRSGYSGRTPLALSLRRGIPDTGDWIFGKGRLMEGLSGMNDIGQVVEADRVHVWHHLSQHKAYETVDPRVIVEGKGMRVWDAKGKEHLDAVSGGVWTVNVGYGRT
jgi:hypothetical protein